LLDIEIADAVMLHSTSSRVHTVCQILSRCVGPRPTVWAAVYTVSAKESVCKFLSCEKFSLHNFLATLSWRVTD